MKGLFFAGFWLAVAAASLVALIRISTDYMTTIKSLQDFEWRVNKLETPSVGVAQTRLEIEISNRSSIDFSVKDLEVYLWLNDVTVGKTYSSFGIRSVLAQQTIILPLTIEMDLPSLSDALNKYGGKPLWHISGSYKVVAPFTDSNIVYRLMLDVDS